MTVTIECFGTPAIVFDGTRSFPRGQQPVTLAALIAAGPEGTTTARLYNDLFGDNPPSSREQAVVMRIQRLRKKLEELVGDIPVVLSGSSVGLNPDACDVDLWTFDEVVRNFAPGWERKLSDWQEPYQNLRDVPDSVTVSAERLRNAYRAGLAQVGWTIDLGDEQDLIQRIEQEIANDPYNERLVTSHAVALYRTHQHAAALDALARFRKTLLDGHGLSPGSDFDRTERAILDYDIAPVLRPQVLAPHQLAERRLTEPTRFLGQADLVLTLSQGVDDLITGNATEGSIQLLVGPGGSGKTTLLAKVLTPFDEERVAVRIGSAEPDGGPSSSGRLYKPFVEALPNIARWLDGSTDAANETQAPVDEEEFWQLVHRTLQDAATAQPTVLVLENMHDADSASVALLRFLAGASQHPRLTIFVTTREPLDGSLWQATYSTLEQSPGRVSVHHLEPMSLTDIQHLVETDHPAQPLVVRERFARRLEVVSRGNALVATTLSRDAPEDLAVQLRPGAPGPEEAYSHHISGLIDDPQLEQILWVASMIGLAFESTLIVDVLDLDPEVVEAQLERFTQLGLGRRRGLVRWEFDHLLTLNAIADRAAPMRPLLLARLARAGSDNPLRMLRYVAGAGDELELDFRIEQLRHVAGLLEDQGAYDESAHAWTLLSELAPEVSPERLSSLIGAAGVLCRVGRREQAAECRAAAVELARSLGDSESVFRATVAGLPSGEYVGGEDERLGMLLGMTPDERETISPVEHTTWCLRFARLSDTVERAEAVIDSIDDTWPGEPEQHINLHLERLCFEAQRHNTKHVLREMQDLCEICPDGQQRSDLLHRTALIALTEQLPAHEIRPLVTECAAYARTDGTPRTSWSSDVLAATLAMVGLLESSASPTTARTSGHRWGINDVEDNHMVQVFAQLWLDGQVGLAELAIDSVEQEIAMNVAWHAALALAAAVNGQKERSRQECAAVISMLDRQPHGVWAPTAAAVLAEAAYTLGHAPSAERAIEALRPRSGQAIVVGIGSAHLGPVDRYLGLASAVVGGSEASDFLERAVAQARLGGITAWEKIAEQDLALIRT